MQLRTTVEFDAWRQSLKDAMVRRILATRLQRVVDGNLGQTRSVGDGVFELKIDFGPGFRVYYTRRGAELLLLLCGGDKSTQSADIEKAKWIAKREDGAE